MTIVITRCPECETSFRVSDVQLGAAGGIVRCGACLEVFRAMDHRVDVPAQSPLPAAGAGHGAAAPETGGSAALPDAAPEAGTEEMDNRSGEASHDETADEWVNEDDGDLYGDEYRNDDRDDEDDSILDDPSDPWTRDEETASAGAEEDELPAAEQPAPFEWRFEPAPAQQQDAIGSMGFGRAIKQVDEGAIDTSLAAQDETFEPPGDLDADEPRTAAIDDPAQDGELEPSDEPFMVDSDPEDLVVAGGAGRGLRLRWWFAASLMLLLGGAQYLWFERDRLALDPRYRDDWLAVCRYLPCDLPPYREPEALSINGLIVRTHSEAEDALRVDALLANEARYRQAFPLLRLRFSDLDDVLVASRVFSPDEYLAGEMSGIRMIPGNTEVRVTFEIVDPGREAVSYRLDIL